MIKNFKFYMLIWIILLVAWCCNVFLVHPINQNYVIRYDIRFWTSFVFILCSYIGNLICAYFAFKAENLNKLFLNLPLITVSWSLLITMIVVGSIFMLIPDFPVWVTAIICILIFAINVIVVVNGIWAANTVNETNNKTKSKTSFIKNIIITAESILDNAQSDEVKNECKKVYEAFRYSDPMSNENLVNIENEITKRLSDLATVIYENDIQKVKKIADELLVLINKRNINCKLLK